MNDYMKEFKKGFTDAAMADLSGILFSGTFAWLILALTSTEQWTYVDVIFFIIDLLLFFIMGYYFFKNAVKIFKRDKK